VGQGNSAARYFRPLQPVTGGISTASGTGSAISETVHGQLLDSVINQGAPPGSYSDTITVTLTY
jgi:spore coat protein U-like protein